MSSQRQAFPPPPEFYKLHKKLKDDTDEQAPQPPQPVDGEYRIFGEIHEVRLCVGLESWSMLTTGD